jgi:hypothetical protein
MKHALLGSALSLAIGLVGHAQSVPGGPSGTPGVWEALSVPSLASGDYIQSVVADPVNPGYFYIAAGNNDGRAIKWWRTTDFGDTWTLRNNTSMNGNPWGFSIDPNPNRDPSTLPTLFSPAGYGSVGAWKSTDGAATWTRLAGGDAAFGSYNPFGTGLTDLYHLCILPDDPPNHVLATYHYYFKNNTEGGFGETWDGGTTWVVHPPPPGVGTSHYVIPVSGTTWCVIAQDNNGANGIWRTTTAGRVGGTAGAKFRDGTISAAAWSKVSTLEHMHGSFQAWKSPTGAWYVPAWTAIGKSTDDGATWQVLASGNWPGTSAGVRTSNIVGTATYVYTNYEPDPEHARALLTDDTTWDRAYCPTTTAAGGNPYGTGVAYASSIGRYVLLMGSQNGMWRYIESATSPPPTTPPPSSTPPPVTTTPPVGTAADGSKSGGNGHCGCGTAAPSFEGLAAIALAVGLSLAASRRRHG